MASKPRVAKREKKRAAKATVKGVARAKPAGSQHRASQADPAVVAFLRKLDHPLKPQIEAVRQIILGASREIREGIKWNAPSFRTKDYFATLNLRAKDGKDRVWLILHKGAKVKDNSTKGMTIPDPAGLLQWLAEDRCLLTFADGKDIRSRRTALQAIVRGWIRQL